MSWEVIVKLGSPIAAVIAAYLVYRRSLHVDAVSAKTGVATESRAGQAQIMEGQQDFIAVLQEDNRLLRIEITTIKLDCRKEIAIVKSEVNALRKEVDRLYRKYGENKRGGE